MSTTHVAPPVAPIAEALDHSHIDSAKDAEAQRLRKAVDEAHETLDKSGRLQRRAISHLGLRARIEALLDIMNDMAGERDAANAQLEACKGVLKEWQDAERKARKEAAIELERATYYRAEWQNAMAAGRALAAQFAKHDGCSRWSAADAAAMRGGEAAAGEVAS